MEDDTPLDMDRTDCFCSCCIAFCLSVGLLFITSSLLNFQIFLMIMCGALSIVIIWNCYFTIVYIHNTCLIGKAIKQRRKEIEMTAIKSGDTCSICLEACVSGVELECHHVFHKKCIEKWLDTKMTCPNCRLAV